MHAHTSSLNALWARARAMLSRALNVIGAPLIIAALAYVPIERRRLIRAWIARLEHITRKLLLAEATQLTLAPSLHRRRGGTTVRSAARRRKSFITISRRRSAQRRRTRATGRAQDHAKHLAARLTALQQALADPAPYARRLARRLRTAPAQALALAAAASRSALTDPADARLPIEATEIALNAAHNLPDTS